MLEDPKNHRAGSATPTVRDVGSASKSAKSTRTPYTEQDDQFLVEWVRTHQEDHEAGNYMYKQLQLHVRLKSIGACEEVGLIPSLE